jgi:uncharacterized protein
MKFNIFDLLLPRETKFFDFLKEQADILIEACVVFRNLATNMKHMDQDEIKKEINIIKDIEKKGDEVETKIINELHSAFITPFDREDIHSITMHIDKALDILTSISNRIDIYDINKLPKNIQKFSELIVEIAEVLKKLLEDLEKKRNIDLTIKAMHTLENNADYLFYISVADLFKKENDPIDIIRLKDVYEYLESVVDAIDYVGKIIRRVMIKNG